MARSIGYDDMEFHALFIGSTGAGKTNALLYWLSKFFADRKDVSLVLIDPHGDAAVDLVRLIPKSERERITILDPTYVSFGLNPLALPAGTEGPDRVNVIQHQAEELSALLSDVFNTDAATAPRLMWVFKGALYYLYYLYILSDNPTFRDLYRILVDFISMHRSDIEAMLRSRALEDEIIRCTIDASPSCPRRPSRRSSTGIELRPPPTVDNLEDLLLEDEQARLRRDDGAGEAHDLQDNQGAALRLPEAHLRVHRDAVLLRGREEGGKAGAFRGAAIGSVQGNELTFNGAQAGQTFSLAFGAAGSSPSTTAPGVTQPLQGFTVTQGQSGGDFIFVRQGSAYTVFPQSYEDEAQASNLLIAQMPQLWHDSHRKRSRSRTHVEILDLLRRGPLSPFEVASSFD